MITRINFTSSFFFSFFTQKKKEKNNLSVIEIAMTPNTAMNSQVVVVHGNDYESRN